MNVQLITAILSSLFILIIFKIIYLEKSPFKLTRFWLIQLAAIAVWWIPEIRIEPVLAIPYSISFLLILIAFLIFNRRTNPFTTITFWFIQLAGILIVTVAIFLFFLCVLGEKRSTRDNLFEDVQTDAIVAVTIIQMQDTVHVKHVNVFLDKLTVVESAGGPVKYANKGKIIFTRTDGSKDSIRTNGYGYGPYKGKWYQSKENVLEQFINK